METHIEYFYNLKGPFYAFCSISVVFFYFLFSFFISETFLASGSLSSMQFQIWDNSKKSGMYGMYVVKGPFEAQGFNGHALLSITDQIVSHSDDEENTCYLSF